MIRRFTCTAVLVLALVIPVSAQFAVFDPANYANALLRYAQLQQQLAQLITTYQQIRTQYLLLKQQAEKLPFAMEARYRALRTPWRSLAATNVYGVTTNWIDAANTGHDAAKAYALATQTLLSYADAIGQLSAEEAARVKMRYDRVQLADGTITTGLEALGRLRFHQGSVETTIRNLEEDTYSDNPDLHTQIAVLNKINATSVASARVAKDTNYLLVSLLEQQLVDATDRRDAAVQGIDAHIAFLNEAGPLLKRTTEETTNALSTFRIP
jgi:hypothetical protein